MMGRVREEWEKGHIGHSSISHDNFAKNIAPILMRVCTRLCANNCEMRRNLAMLCRLNIVDKNIRQQLPTNRCASLTVACKL
jgi:hypothetical protein